MILVIDNYDSFTFNLVQYLGELAQSVLVRRNDCISLQEIQDLNPTAVVISPGPGRPQDAGISLEAIRRLGPQMPILGVCLGHQAIGESFGGRVVSAPRLMHGKTSPIFFNGSRLFTRHGESLSSGPLSQPCRGAGNTARLPGGNSGHRSARNHGDQAQDLSH